MPQIAQQDYNIIRPVVGPTINADAPAIAKLVENIERGTIFDCLLFNAGGNNDEYSCVLGANRGAIGFFSVGDNATGIIEFGSLSVEQWQGLAAVQIAAGATDIPNLEGYQGFLTEDNRGSFVCVGGKKLSYTVNDGGYILAVSVSELSPSENDRVADISFEDAQKLIGLYVNEG